MSPTFTTRRSSNDRSRPEALYLLRRMFVLLIWLQNSSMTSTAFTVLPSSSPPDRSSRTLREVWASRRVFLVRSTANSTTEASSDTSGCVDVNDSQNDIEDDYVDDEALLESVTKTQLADWCGKLRLPLTGTKAQLLRRLRQHAQEQIHLERRLRADRVRRVEEGDNGGQNPQHSKERHEIVRDPIGARDLDKDEDDEENVFYFPLSTPADTNATPPQQTSSAPKPPLTREAVTAPPPPEYANEQGERVVTVYSSADHNDLTGVAAAQPGQATSVPDSLGAVASSTSASPGIEPWERSQGDQTTHQVERATEAVTELVQCLLAMTGAPGFESLGMGDDDDDDESEGSERALSSLPRPTEFVGFQPSKVPTALLAASSKALRTRRGQILQGVLRKFELQAIGHDGLAGDNVDRGGGHYREVSKVRAFLEGYRRAEVRRMARETAALLLDKLVLEGVEGLDAHLASMTRSGDEASDHAGELNDSLLGYLNDAIRQQEKKVALAAETSTTKLPSDATHLPDATDTISSLWTVESEDGRRVESIDPSDPKVKQALLDEYAKSEEASTGSPDPQVPSSPSEQLLLLLKLLRQRMEAEAAFAPDEKGRNLRLLAYCLRVTSSSEYEHLIRKETGSSMDRLDSFLELVSSSIEYGESTSHQLQPSKSMPLNVRQLKTILDVAQTLRKQLSLPTSRGV